MIGGAPTTRAWADEIGADGYAEDAIEAVVAAKALLGVERGAGPQSGSLTPAPVPRPARRAPWQ